MQTNFKVPTSQDIRGVSILGYCPAQNHPAGPGFSSAVEKMWGALLWQNILLIYVPISNSNLFDLQVVYLGATLANFQFRPFNHKLDFPSAID